MTEVVNVWFLVQGNGGDVRFPVIGDTVSGQSFLDLFAAIAHNPRLT